MQRNLLFRLLEINVQQLCNRKMITKIKLFFIIFIDNFIYN